MLVSIQDLRSIQERCDVGELAQRLDVSIDRLTVIWDTDTGSLRRIFKNLKQAISTRVDSFEIYDNVRDDVFTLAKVFNEYDSINIIFFQLSIYGGEQLIRIDFNPNTLKEFDGMKVWRQLMYFARLNSLTVRLSRFDLAFDIFNRPEIVNLQHIKGGVTHKVFYGRGGELETKYWGSSGSNVQVRLYDKNKEIIAHKREEKLDLAVNPFWWRLEFQLRTKAIGEEMVQDIMNRLDNFGFYKLEHIRVEQRAFTIIFLNNPELLSLAFPNLKSDSIKKKKTRVDSFEIYDNVRDDVFTLAKVFNEYDSINIIFFQLSIYGGEQLIRIDFNPNTLKEFDGMKVWRQLMYFARLNSLTVRLSRFDLAFDIFNRPEIVNLQHIKGGVTHKVFYGRGGELETKYWGSSGSNVQVRLYDKNKEIIAHKREEKLDLAVNPFWWRLEFQLRTKAIGEEMVQDIMNRLDNFGFYKLEHIRVEQRAFTIIFLNNPELLSLAFPNLKSDSIKKKKTRVRKLLREETNQFAEELKEVLIQNLPKLNTELQLLVGEFLNLENK